MTSGVATLILVTLKKCLKNGHFPIEAKNIIYPHRHYVANFCAIEPNTSSGDHFQWEPLSG